MTSQGATLRVATWNIRAAIGPGKPFPDRWWRLIDLDRLRRIGDVIADLEADVVALQEVALVSRAGELLDAAGDLGRQLGMEVRYGATRTFDVTDADGAVTGAGCFGNALLSRLPIGPTRALLLPMAPLEAFVEPPGTDHAAAGIRYAEAPEGIRERRTLLLAEVGGVMVGSTHLSHVGSGERAMQADATTAAFGDAAPAVLLGDLNAAAGAPELAAFGGWIDAFTESGVPAGDERRVSTDDGWRIDHILLRGAAARGCRVALEAGDLSDHYPVVADLSF